MSEHFRKYIKKEHYPVHPSNIRFKTSFTNCILEALKRRTWKEVDHETEWDIFWTEKEWIHDVMDHIHLGPNQRVNHFRNYYELCRKDNLIKNLKRHKRNLEKEGNLDDAAAYNFFPTTYTLPGEYSIFCEEFKKNNNSVWIMIHIGKAQGKGIFLFNKLSQVSQWKTDNRWKPDSPQVESYIVQRYINNPLLIGGKKFDMRIYCLVTSYAPLTAYLYRDGFARFTHHRYDNEDITNTFVHLTNVAIQKTSENYDEKLGGKWDLRKLKLYLMSEYGQEAVSECFANIQTVMIRALQSVQKVMINDKHCFELYGFDILLDAQLKPWLLEVNGSPSMTANTEHDFELKCNLLDDVFTIIDIERVLTGQEEQIGGFDLICKGTPIKNESSLFSTMLSCYNNRSQQLKKLAKVVSSRLAQAYIQQEKEEAKKNSLLTKDGSSVSTPMNDLGLAAKGQMKNGIASKTSSTTTASSKISKAPTLVKQNTIPLPNTNKDPKEVKEAARPINSRPKEYGRGKTIMGVSGVNSITSSPQVTALPSAYGTNTTPISGGSNNTAVKGGNFPAPVNPVLTNSGLGKQWSSQPTQNQNDKFNSMKLPSTLQLAGEASLKLDMGPSYENGPRGKDKNVANMQDFQEQRQTLYSSKVEDKSDRYNYTKGSEDILNSMVGKGKDTQKKQLAAKVDDDNSNEEFKSYPKKKNESEESNENYEISHEDEYE